MINEAYIVSNGGKTAWNDPAGGTLRFFLPAAAEGKVQVGATPPGGQPLQQAAQKTGESGVYKINFAMRPGDTRVDLTYTVPYNEGAPYAGKVVTHDDNTYLIVPNGVTLKGDNLGDLGQEPRTQAHIYRIEGRRLQGATGRRGIDAERRGQHRLGGDAGRQPADPADHAARQRKGEGHTGLGAGDTGAGVRAALSRAGQGDE